ncbi:tobH protein [Rhodococcus sp. 15-2388-1-1a]|uniref:TobH protein n=1 Tax=Nocardiaceae TaxID=85025 RepID=UPI0005691D2E|nr:MULTISPECIES: TobH protein [Rhodococcus]OZF01708.1 tobH protein [Rhodococcus sp. 15-2388-1-1a]
MTAVSSLVDLDDSDALIAADREGSLRSAALAGAQVRAVATAVDESVLARLADLRPRSVVIVTGDGRSSRAASLLVAALGDRLGVPLVRSTGTPPWIGPLDVVVVAGDDAGDPRLAESVDAAARRGAEVVVVAPEEGPLRAVRGARVMWLPPRIAVRDHNALMRYLAAFVAVLGAVAGGSWKTLLPNLSRLADLLDAEAVRNSPSNEMFHNPAKALASGLNGRRVVLTGGSPVAVEVARHGSEVLLRVAGVVVGAGELGDVIAASIRASVVESSRTPQTFDSLFHDEQLDGPPPALPMRVIVVASDADRAMTERRIAGVPESELLLADSSEALFGGERARSEFDNPAAAPDPARLSVLDTMSVLATRLDTTAAYLLLMGGS